MKQSVEQRQEETVKRQEEITQNTKKIQQECTNLEEQLEISEQDKCKAYDKISQMSQQLMLMH